MKKHLFLTGLSGCGKSTMIRKALGEKLGYAGGFVTERVRSAEGTLLGYDLFPAAAAGGRADRDARPAAGARRAARGAAAQAVPPFSFVLEYTSLNTLGSTASAPKICAASC